MLHKGHPGITRMKTIAREHVYWSGIDRDIEDWTRSCSPCQQAAKAPIKHTLCTWPEESKPWSRIHIDFAGPLHGQMYLVIVDAFSKWPEIVEMTSSTTTSTINVLQRLFAQFGLPETIVSDNGTQFTSAVFQEYCRENTIKHIKSPPFHPQSNGQAERFVDTFKRALMKLKDEGTYKESLQIFLFSYRTTPCASLPNGRFPAENFLGRKLRSILTELHPRTIEHDTRRSGTMEKQFNRHHGARSRHFQNGDLVFVRDYRPGSIKWTPGQIFRRRGRVLYDISVERKLWRRHVNQVRPRQNTTCTKTLLETFDLPCQNITTGEIDKTALEPKETDTEDIKIPKSILKAEGSPNNKKSVHFQEQRTESDKIRLQPEQSIDDQNPAPFSPSEDSVVSSPPVPSTLLPRRSNIQRHIPSRLELDPSQRSYTYQ